MLRDALLRNTLGTRPTSFTDVIAEGGPMVELLRDPRFLPRRLFVRRPKPANGFDVDAINLHMEMEKTDALKSASAA